MAAVAAAVTTEVLKQIQQDSDKTRTDVLVDQSIINVDHPEGDHQSLEHSLEGDSELALMQCPLGKSPSLSAASSPEGNQEHLTLAHDFLG